MTKEVDFIVIAFCWSSFKIFFAVSTPETPLSASYVTFSPESLLPKVPKRLLDPGWKSTQSIVSCARKSVGYFPQSKGFLYNSDSGLCTPLLWLEEQSVSGAKGLQEDEGEIFLNRAISSCTGQFQLYEVGSSGSLACMLKSTTTVNFYDARAECEALGSHLASVRTFAKMALVRAIADRDAVWVGFDDLQTEGTFIWHDTREVLAFEELSLFATGEPNDNVGYGGFGDCGRYSWGFGGLDDENCLYLNLFLCEIDLSG